MCVHRDNLVRQSKRVWSLTHAGAEPHPVLPQALRLDSKTGSGTKQASLVADETAELPVTTISVVSLLGLYSRVAHVCV